VGEESTGSSKRRGPGRRQNGSSIQGYFRQVLADHPQWVEMRSNDPIFAQYLADHPGESEVPQGAKNGLSNVKSSLRNKVRKAKKGRGRPRKVVAAGTTHAAPTAVAAKTKVSRTMEALEALEEQIDDCLSVARHLGKEDLHQVCLFLKRARSAVVMKMGE
jgi:ketosteroid isomerase-like protein